MAFHWGLLKRIPACPSRRSSPTFCEPESACRRSTLFCSSLRLSATEHGPSTGLPSPLVERHALGGLHKQEVGLFRRFLRRLRERRLDRCEPYRKGGDRSEQRTPGGHVKLPRTGKCPRHF